MASRDISSGISRLWQTKLRDSRARLTGILSPVNLAIVLLLFRFQVFQGLIVGIVDSTVQHGRWTFQ